MASTAQFKCLLLLAFCFLAGLALWLGRFLLPEDQTPPAAIPPQAGRPETPRADDLNIRLENLVRYAMPGKEHDLLNRMSGRWITRTRYQTKPGSEVVDAKGSSERKWILDGRFLLEELDGGDLGLPFRGLGLYGYDAFAQRYTSAWVDTMNTSIMTNLGIYDASNDVVHFTGFYDDPWTGQKKKNRGLTRFVSPERHVLELHVTEPDGREFKMLEITYSRR